MAYPFQAIEKKWQSYWDDHKTFRTPDEIDTSKPKTYVLDMFPYPSGSGLHVGHPEGYTATDIIARFKRMSGFNVLHPIGWDAFGLPAEQYALKTNTHPRITTEKNVDRFRQQLKSLGFSYDWDREVNTTDPNYYKWTQWIFEKLYERGLAYQAEIPVWWCEELGTTLANEEVIDGKSEVGGYACVRRPLRQWMLKITAYAERLLEGLDELDWPDSTKEMQRNWIGRSEGAEVDFKVVGFPEEHIRVFTTRPDTLFGATFMVLAPEHPLVDKITTQAHRVEVQQYQQEAIRKSDLERTELQKEKSGVFTGAFAMNPVNGEKIPIWVADYVLATYGTGAIMAVPGQDERDWEFAEQYGLPIIRTVQPPDDFEGTAYTGDGPAINSDATGRAIPGIAEKGTSLNGLHMAEAKRKIIDWLEDEGVGLAKINYKLRDWLFSRQRYWGEPFPVVFVDERPQLVPEADLPVTLPDLEEFKPSGSPEGPLALAEDWLYTTDPETGKTARRETNTMPQWAGSCWYYLRYIDPHNPDQLVDPEKEKYWMPVDLYVGGAEHAVLHLLYARFWHKVLYDAGVIATEEPFRKLVHQGMILGEMEFQVAVTYEGEYITIGAVSPPPGRGIPVASAEYKRVSPDEVEKRDGRWYLKSHPDIEVLASAHKMSKSRGNVVNPDEVISEYGADSFRLYEMFMGPLEQVKPWSTRSVEGPHRFLNRVWRLVILEVETNEELVEFTDLEKARGKDNLLEEHEKYGNVVQALDAEPSKEQLRVLHQTIQKVTDDIEGMRFNTAIAAMMEFVNAANKWDVLPRAIAAPFVLILSPFAPHLSEELWQRLGHDDTLAYEPWPELNEDYLKEDTVEIAVQVNGKVRGSIAIAPDADEETVLETAKQDENVARHLDGKTMRREIYVPGRIVNFVAN